ncbi:MAG: ferredoxin reductase family protein [Candidatus Dormibacteria bacterium]
MADGGENLRLLSIPKELAVRSTAASRRSSRVPRTWPLRSTDLSMIVFAIAVLIAGMWVRHGQLANLTTPGAVLSAGGQLTALLGTYSALVQVVLMSRSPWVDQLYGIDRIAGWHRWLGFATVYLICAHVVFTTAGYAVSNGLSFVSETGTFISTYPFVLMAYVATALFILVAVVSVRAARRRLSHGTWHFIHLYIYLAIVLSFPHQLAVGTDFERDPLAVGFWVALFVVAGVLVLAFRVIIPVRIAMRHQLRISAISEEARGVISIYITGRRLNELPMRAGQFFKFRFLARGFWWRVHPFSLSAAPNGQYLRITVKEVGDFTAALRKLEPGTKVIVEGPYGIFTSIRRRLPRVVLIAGGIGITPLRALLEEMPQRKNTVILIYRASSWEDVVFQPELDQLMSERAGVVHYIVGRRGQEVALEPLGPRVLRTLVPDLRERDIYICGPPDMLDGVGRSLDELKIPARQIHRERFAFL